MKQGWEIKKLGEICNKITNIKWNEIDKTTSFPYIDLSAVDRENSSIHDYEYINISNAPSRAKQIVKVGDILFATTRPMLKRACIIPNEFNNAIASTGFCVLRPQGTVLSEWIYHNIKSNRFYKYIEPIQKGVSYPAVTDNEVKDFCIPIPPRAEQERIVAELDCLSGVIERKREQLKQLDALAQSIFYQMFGDPITNEKGWEVKTIGDVCKLKSGDSSANNTSEGALPYIKVGDMNMSENVPYITTSSTMVSREENIKGIFPIGTTIFPKRGGAIFTNKKRLTTVEICCDLNTMGVIPMHEVLPLYIFHFFIQIDFGELCNGAAIPQINNIDIAPLKICVPPLTLQQEFADKIEAIEKQKELIKQSITETEELFNSRMDYYFN